jgi:hypothetical protein
MSNDTPRRRGGPRGRRKHRLALIAASVTGLVLAAPGNAQLGAVQSQSGSNGVLQAVVTNVQVTGNTVQAPVRVNAPVRVLSPGNDAGGGEARTEAGGGGGGSASQSQSGSNGAAQVGVTNVQVAGNTVQAPVQAVMPIRILSPGEDRGDTSAAATADGGADGSASQSQNGENGALQALLTSIQVVGITAQAPIAVYAPVRVLSPGDNGGGATASTDTGGGGSGPASQTQNGENGTAQAGVTNVQIAGNTVQAPIAAYAPVRVLSPGDNGGGATASTDTGGGGSGPASQTQNGENGTAQAGVTNAQVADNAAQAPVAVTAPVRVLSPGGETGPGNGGGPGGGGPGGGGPGGGGPGGGGTGPGGEELGAGARGATAGSVVEVLAATASGGSLPFTGAPVGVLALLGAGLLLLGSRLRAAGTESVR